MIVGTDVGQNKDIIVVTIITGEKRLRDCEMQTVSIQYCFWAFVLVFNMQGI